MFGPLATPLIAHNEGSYQTGHFTRMSYERLPKKVFCGELQEGNRSKDGQKKRYKDTFKASLKNFYPEKSLVMRKPDFRICENKDADQLRGDREADQRLCFHYINSTIPLLSIYEISSL